VHDGDLTAVKNSGIWYAHAHLW